MHAPIKNDMHILSVPLSPMIEILLSSHESTAPLLVICCLILDIPPTHPLGGPSFLSGFTQARKVLEFRGFLEKSLKIKYALISTVKITQKP